MKAKFLGIIVFILILTTCFCCITTSFADDQECTHGDDKIEWYAKGGGINNTGDTNNNKIEHWYKPLEDPYDIQAVYDPKVPEQQQGGAHIHKVFWVGRCKVCWNNGITAEKRQLIAENLTEPHTPFFDSTDGITDTLKCPCGGYTIHEPHKHDYNERLVNTRELDHFSQVKGNDDQHKTWASFEYQCKCGAKKRESRSNDFQWSDHTHVERIKKKELYAYNDANISEVNHIVVYSAAFQCICGHEIPDDELWEEEGEHTFPNLVENKPTTPWELKKFISYDDKFHKAIYLAFFSCDCGFAGDRREITYSDSHTFDRSVSYSDSDGSRYYKCTLSPYGCNAKCEVKKDDHEHEMTLGTISSTGPSSALGGRQPYCRICGATECEINGCVYKPATCTDPEICNRCGQSSGTKLGHLYDYDHPQKEHGVYVVRFFCKRPGCSDSTTHSHDYSDVGSPQKTDNIREYNDAKHQREYDILQKCQLKLGNGQDCTGSCWRFYEWREESHTVYPVGDPVMKDAVQFSSSDSRYKTKHMRRYEQNYECKCGFSAGQVDRKDEAHKWGREEKKAATCTEDGYTVKVCDYCGQVDRTTLTRTEHAWVNDGNEQKSNEVRVLGSGNTKEFVNHERKYVQKQKCTNSNCPTKTRTVTTWKAEKHDWPAWTKKEATCVAQGSRTRVCRICEKKQKEILPIDENNHDFLEPKIVRAACHPEGGIAVTHCSRCPKEKTYKPTKTSHTVKTWTVVTEATCTAKGVKKGTCTKCKTVVTYTIPLKEHLYAGSPPRCKFCRLPKGTELQ